jgi:glycosyltransferase involved in cell wall biosynthesis
MAAEERGLPRVLFCIGGLERGGSEMQLVALLERLHGSRVDASVALLSRAVDPVLGERLRHAGVNVILLGPRRGLRPWRMMVATYHMAGLLARRRPDAVYAWLEEAALLTAPLCRLTRTPYLIARRNILGPYAKWGTLVMRGIGLAERQAQVVTVNSHAVGAVTLARGVPKGRIRLIRNGHVVEPQVPMPPDGEIVIGYLARFREEKGHLRLLDVLSRVRAPANWRVDLAGDGELQEKVAAEARRLGLQDRVRFVGAVGDARAFWAERHLAVLLSDHEGSPNVLIEAAMVGRPIVATAVGGVPEVVGADGGILVASDDRDAAAEAIRALIEDRELRERVGAAAHAHAVERFAMERSVQGHLAAIAEVLSKR